MEKEEKGNDIEKELWKSTEVSLGGLRLNTNLHVYSETPGQQRRKSGGKNSCQVLLRKTDILAINATPSTASYN